MKVIDESKPVIVTGATGYMASWVVKQLLEEGISVNATVRDPSNAEKVAHLTALAEASPGELRLFKADLLEPGSFDEPMKGCELVIHTASPFFLAKPKDPEQELIRPAKEGTRNVLEAAERTPTVKRVVATSSTTAIIGDVADIKSCPGGVATEKEWNTTSSADHMPYSYSKTIAEQEAWSIARQQDRWDLVVVNPALILGPSQSKRTGSESMSLMLQFADGTFKSGAPEMGYPWVDVRDVAAAHLKAGFTPEASGRHVISSVDATFLDIGKLLRKNFGDAYPFPRRTSPKWMLWLIAPYVGLTRGFVSKNVGFHAKFDNSYSKTDLGMTYIPFETTVKEHFQQILDDGLLSKPPRAT